MFDMRSVEEQELIEQYRTQFCLSCPLKECANCYEGDKSTQRNIKRTMFKLALETIPEEIVRKMFIGGKNL